MRPENARIVRTWAFGKGPVVVLLTLESMTGLGNASLVIWGGRVVSKSYMDESVVYRGIYV
jgi:hypothetical protein